MLVGWAILMTMLRDDYWSAYVYQFRRFFVESYAPPAEEHSLSNFLVSVAASARVLVLLLLATAVGDLLLRWRRYSILEKYILFMGLAFFLSMCLF